MANTITLRAYLDELEHLLDSRSPTEVISHCRYILQHYPRNVDAYRLLGRALLERGERDGVAEHYDEALEVFRRVLGVLPNDYLAHLGVSQVFQEKGDLERAIWHLERAYEQMPGNQALQEALRELYAQRSGAEGAPARLQLTRGALVHQYLRAQQYEQALIELRAALAEEKDERLDLQVLLAQVLWEAGHAEEAAEQAARILEVLPNCLEANRIMARYWLAHERPSDAQVFLERIEAVDPYEARRTLQPQSDAPDPNLLPRLDYGIQAQAATSAETPDWVEELGDLGDFAMEQGSPFAMEPEAPAAPLDTDTLFGASFQTEAPAEPPADWMGETGAPSSFDVDKWPEPGTPPEPSVTGAEADAPLDFGEDWPSEADLGAVVPESPSDDAPLPPDWLDEAPPTEDMPRASDWPSETELSAPEPEPPTSDDAPLPPDWLDEAEETSGETVAESGWMADVGEAPHTATAELAPITDADAEPEPTTSAEDEASWLFSLDETEERSAEDEKSAESPPTGFTGLLEDIQTQRAVQETTLDEDENAEPEPPSWLADFVATESDEAAIASGPSASETASSEPEPESAAADLFELFEEAEEKTETASEPEATADEEQPAEEKAVPLDAPEWLVEPEYDFFAPEATSADEAAPAVSETEATPQDATDDWLSQLDEVDQSDLADVLSSAEDEWKAAEEQPADDLGWLSEAQATSTDEDAVEALFAEVEEAALTEQKEATPADQQSQSTAEEAASTLFAEPQTEDDWLAALPSDEETVLTTAEAESEVEGILPEGDAAVKSVLDTLEATVPELEESADEPLAFEAVDEALFGEDEHAEVAPPRTSSLEERIAQISESVDSPAWLAGMEAEVPPETEQAHSDEGQTIEYRAAGQTGILQPDEAPAWMAAFTGEDVPEEPETETGVAEQETFGAPEAVITPPEDLAPEQAEAFSTRILQPETPTVTDGDFDLFGEDTSAPVEAETVLDTDELFADVLGETTDAEAEVAEEGELPAWLQAITQSEADKLDVSLFEEVEPYSSSAEDSGILQPGQEDEWLQVLGDEGESTAAPTDEVVRQEAEEDLLGFLKAEASAGESSAEERTSEAEEDLPEDDEALLDFLDVDAAAIAEMDFEDIAAELEEAAQPEADDVFRGPSEEPTSPISAPEEQAFGAVAEASDLSHTMAERAHASAVYAEGETLEASASADDDFSFDGVVPRWLRRPREQLAETLGEATPDDDAPSEPPEWLRGVSEDPDRQDRDDLQ